MKSLAELKRRIAVGTILKTVSHSRPQLIGTLRVVGLAQTNAFASRFEGKDELSWTYYPPSKHITFTGPDTFKIEFPDSIHFAELQIVKPEEVSAHA